MVVFPRTDINLRPASRRDRVGADRIEFARIAKVTSLPFETVNVLCAIDILPFSGARMVRGLYAQTRRIWPPLLLDRSLDRSRPGVLNHS